MSGVRGPWTERREGVVFEAARGGAYSEQHGGESIRSGARGPYSKWRDGAVFGAARGDRGGKVSNGHEMQRTPVGRTGSMCWYEMRRRIGDGYGKEEGEGGPMKRTLETI